MDNKGFTLIELIVVIAIIAAMAGLFAVNMTNIYSSLKGNEKNRITSDLELAADAYVNSNKNKLPYAYQCNTIKTDILIDNGYLKLSNGTSYRALVTICADANGVLSFS